MTTELPTDTETRKGGQRVSDERLAEMHRHAEISFDDAGYDPDPREIASLITELQHRRSVQVEASLAAPHGFLTVPVEPTEEMLDAYWRSTGESNIMRERIHFYATRYYRAMLLAAPPLPSSVLEYDCSSCQGHGNINGRMCVDCAGTGVFPPSLSPIGKEERNRLSALSTPKAEGWQPIETAPKDGTRFLYANAFNSKAVVWTIHRENDLWFTDGGSIIPDKGAGSPTHWQPLPEKPDVQ